MDQTIGWKIPIPGFAEGMPPDQIVTQEFYLLSWCAGLLLGAGKDARPLLEMVKEDCFPELWPPSVADCLLDAAVLPAGKAPQHRQQLVPLLMENLDSFLSALEEQTGAPELAGRTRDELQKKINLPSVAAKDLDCLAASGCEGM